MTETITASIKAHPRPTFVYDALQTGVESGNALLIDYCRSFLHENGLVAPEDIDTRYETAARDNLVWLDTASPLGDAARNDILADKITRTVQQVKALQQGSGFMCHIAIPALNEEATLPTIIDSFRTQQVDTPTVLTVADNNSTDTTAALTREMGGNVVAATRPGTGAARQTVLDTILAASACPEQTIIVQTDADCEATPGYLQAAIDAYKNDSDILVGVGPSIYSIPLENGEVLEVATARDYGTLLGTMGLRGYFEALGKRPEDYLIEPPYRYLIGPNTTYRASLFTKHNVRYPLDGRWETLDLSVQIQRQIPSAKSIRYIDDQRMHVSSRAILAGAPHLTQQRLQEIRAHGYVHVFKEGGVNCSPLSSMRTILGEIDTERAKKNLPQTAGLNQRPQWRRRNQMRDRL